MMTACPRCRTPFEAQRSPRASTSGMFDATCPACGKLFACKDGHISCVVTADVIDRWQRGEYS